MTDLPADVRATLAQLLSEGEELARRRETETVHEVVDTVDTVARNKLPAGRLRSRLRHGCARVRATAADEPLVAAAYLSAMGELLKE